MGKSFDENRVVSLKPPFLNAPCVDFSLHFHVLRTKMLMKLYHRKLKTSTRFSSWWLKEKLKESWTAGATRNEEDFLVLLLVAALQQNSDGINKIK